MIVDCVIEMYKIAYVCACELAPKNSEYIFQNTPRSFLYKKKFFWGEMSNELNQINHVITNGSFISFFKIIFEVLFLRIFFIFNLFCNIKNVKDLSVIRISHSLDGTNWVVFSYLKDNRFSKNLSKKCLALLSPANI